jgi:hypothetical protein
MAIQVNDYSYPVLDLDEEAISLAPPYSSTSRQEKGGRVFNQFE